MIKPLFTHGLFRCFAAGPPLGGVRRRASLALRHVLQPLLAFQLPTRNWAKAELLLRISVSESILVFHSLSSLARAIFSSGALGCPLATALLRATGAVMSYCLFCPSVAHYATVSAVLLLRILGSQLLILVNCDVV